MKSIFLTAATLVGLAVTSVLLAAPIRFDWATVGDVNNPADPLNPLVGRVAYQYKISTYETTNAQYVSFMNAVDPTGANTLGLYNPAMTSQPNTFQTAGGIDFISANPAGSKYRSKTGLANHPVTYVSWLDAARMANWMHNGQTAGGTETGVYNLTGPLTGIIPRSASATIVIPTRDEWYKAAYFQPTSAGGDADGWWMYPTRSNDLPGNALSGTIPNRANYPTSSTGYSVTQTTTFDPSQVYTTDAGAFAASASYYGTFDQGGNAAEFTATPSSPQFANTNWTAGGNWRFGPLARTATTVNNVSQEFHNSGFRLAAIPEPTVLTLVAGLGFGLYIARGRR